MSAHNVVRFPFDRIFTTVEPGENPSVADSLLELSALRAELQAVRSAQESALATARAEGMETGLKMARGERDAALLSAIDAMHGAIETLDERFGETVRRLTGEATDVALAAADLIAGHAIALDPAITINEGIGRVLGQVARGTELQVRVHPSLVAAIEERIAGRQREDRRKLQLSVRPDATLAPGDALISWEQGGLALDAAARRGAIAAELEILLSAAPALRAPD